MDFKKAFEKVDENRDYIVEILQKIIAVDTSVPPGKNYGALLDVVEPELAGFGFSNKRVIVPDECVKQMPWALSGPRENLVSSRENGRPKASVYAHMDVVPVDEPWEKDPFSGEVVDGKVYGRGAVDMKGSIACFLGAMKVLSDLKIEPSCSIDCLLCTDEEIGVYPGARYLAEQGYFSNHLVWLELGASMPGLGLEILGAAGCIRIDVTGKGKSCHSGMNFLGVNAVEETIPIMNELLILKKEVEARESRIPAFPRPEAPSDKLTPMFNLAVINGGTKENIVPGQCRLTINRRYIPDEKYEDVIAEIHDAIAAGRKKSKLLDVEIHTAHMYPPVEIDPDSPAAAKARQAKKAVHGDIPVISGGIAGSTDLGFVMEILKAKKPEVALFGNVRADNILAHCADEYTNIDDLAAMTKELVHYLAF